MMLTLSLWAKRNPAKSRVIITLCSILVAYVGVQFGIMADARNVLLGNSFVVLSVILFISGAMFYPIKGFYTGQTLRWFALTRRFGFLLILGSFLLAIFAGNKLPEIFPAPVSENAPIIQLVALKKIEGNKLTKKTTLKDKVSLLVAKRIQKKFEKWQAKSPDSSKNGGRIALGILLLIAALVAMYLVAVLSCSLACSGSGGLAWITLILGLVGVVALFSLSFRKLFPKMTKKETWWVGAGVIVGIVLLLLIPGLFN